MGKLEELKVQYDALDKEAGKYNRPEFDRVYSIIAELVQDRDDVGDKGNLDYPLVTGDIIKEALSQVGYANDEEFVADFKKYREIEQKARDIQLEALSLPEHPVNLLMKEIKGKENRKTGWRFCAPSVIAPGQMAPTMNDIFESDAKEGKGLFTNITNIPKEDESEDELLMANAFGVQGSLYAYRNNLEKYGVIGESGFLNDDFRKLLFMALNSAARFVKDHPDAPAKIKNHIGDILKWFDRLPVWGLFFQILILQGLCEWMGALDIDEGGSGYDEATSVYNWLCGTLGHKEVQFCNTPYGDKDEEHLKPLTDYLYSTEMGLRVQQVLFGGRSGGANNSEPKSGCAHFSVAKSYEEMLRILTALQQGGFVSTDTTIDTFYYRMTGKGTPTNDKIGWIKRGKKNNSSISKRSLVYFVETIANYGVSKAKDCTNRIEDIFGLSLSSSTINSTAVCEYKAEIDNIVEAKNNLTGLFAR